MKTGFATFEYFERELDETSNLGGGVVLAVSRSRARPVESPAYVAQPEAYVYACEDGQIARMRNYTDIDEARTAAERLAQETAGG